MTGESDAATLVLGLRIWMALTQDRFADCVGVTQSRVSRWESGKEIPPVRALIRMAELCPEAGRKIPSRAGGPRSEAFLRLAGVEERKANLLAEGIGRIREFVGRVNPDRAQTLDLELRGEGVEEQLEKVLQALDDVERDVRRSTEIPGVSEREADFLKDLYKRVKWGEGKKKR